MFLTEDKFLGSTHLVYTWDDPKKTGFGGVVLPDVTLDYDMEAVHSWPDGHPQPEVCVGQAPDNPRHYKVFKYRSELQSAAYQLVPGTPIVVGQWKDYLRLRHPEELTSEEWFQQLDQYDEASRRRKQRVQAPAEPSGKNRDEVAAWVARGHLTVDIAIREIWYLPEGAPPEEIRLLELSDRLAIPESRPEAIAFGLDVQGTQFRLAIADVTSEQLDQIQHDPSRLPSGWSLQEKKTWRRGA